MNAYSCKPASRPFNGTVTIPGSKSITNRSLITAAMADGTSILKGILLAEDTRLMIDALRALGLSITIDEESCTAEVTGGGGRIPNDETRILCGNAGTVMRFCTAMVAAAFGRFELDGGERMRQRPIGPLGDALQRMGAGIEYLDRERYPPLVVHANGLSGGEVTVDSPQSSQFVSAILLASPFAGRDVMVEATGDVPSRPYLKMTTAVMDAFGAAVVEQYDDRGAKFIVETPQRYAATTYKIEPDASNASYFLAAAGVAGGRVRVEGLGGPSIQGDVRFVDLLAQMGCLVEPSATDLTVTGPTDQRLGCLDVDLNHMPDMVPTLAVLALFADGPTTIRNVANLRLKETDRIAALRTELTKLGAKVEEFTDGLRITPPTRITPATIEPYDDHRMAMSFALVGLRVPGMVINNPDCCAKTFPDYFQRIERLTRGE